MAISEILKKAVIDDDLMAIKSCFYTIVLSDPGFKTNRFDEALEFVKSKNVVNLIDKHDGEELIPEGKWNEEYFDMLASKLQDNFSEERIVQLKRVAKVLSSSNSGSNTQNKTHRSSSKSRIATSSVISSSDYEWIGAIGVAAVAFLVIRHIFKGGK